MANELTSVKSTLSQRLVKEYAKGEIDTSAYPQIDATAVKALIANSEKVCVIHDRINDIVHSYSIILYKTRHEGKFYLVYQGGFGGHETFGFGPIAE